MARTTNKKSSNSATAATVGYKAQLWQMADALRGSMDAAEYKHVVLGLIFNCGQASNHTISPLADLNSPSTASPANN
jgi:hypothetical protein